MMRSVLNEGTGPPARRRFRARRRWQDGHDQRLARRFVGFTPEPLTVVWVGLDDQPLGLSGSQAAAPIWTPFMVRARGPSEPAVRRTAWHHRVVIDRDTGKLAGPSCPRVLKESFERHGTDRGVTSTSRRVRSSFVIRPSSLAPV
jgi:membrane carboxypeptidase/penicillin-binding protein